MAHQELEPSLGFMHLLFNLRSQESTFFNIIRGLIQKEMMIIANNSFLN